MLIYLLQEQLLKDEFDRMIQIFEPAKSILLLPVTLAGLEEIMWKQVTTLREYFLFLM